MKELTILNTLGVKIEGLDGYYFPEIMFDDYKIKIGDVIYNPNDRKFILVENDNDIENYSKIKKCCRVYHRD